MPNPADIKAIADTIKAAQAAVRQIPPITSTRPDFDAEAAYQVADLLHRDRLAKGWKTLGRKIGFTNRNIWPTYNVHQPIWGYVYDKTVVQLGGQEITCPIGGFAEPLLEPEIVLGFQSAPPVTNDLAAILASIEWVAHGIEIVQSHFPNWKFAAADTIADSALHGTLLVGPRLPVSSLGNDPLAALAQFTLSVFRNGALQDEGKGSNVLGSPIAALAHLLEVLRSQNFAPSLEGGEMVTTGTVTRALSIQPGETWVSELDGIPLPGLRVTFTA